MRNSFNEMTSLELIYIIVDDGKGSKILKKAKKYGVSGGTILRGRGTVSSYLLNLLSLYDERKEIVMIGTDSKTAEHMLLRLDEDFQFEKPHHGIVFSTSACEILGSREYSIEEVEERGVDKLMYKNIITVVNRGKAEDVVEAATSVGAKGGTIINGRGSGVNETTKLFNMEIEPEKEIVMIVAKDENSENIVNAIREKLEIDKPGNGIIFIQNINRVYGIYE